MVGTATCPSAIRGSSASRSVPRSRKFVASTGRDAVSANAAPKAIDASAPRAPSYWLPMTTGIRSALHSPSTSRDSENPVRAIFTLT